MNNVSQPKQSPSRTRYTRRSAIKLLLTGALSATAFYTLAKSASPSVTTGYWGKGIRPDIYYYVRDSYDLAFLVREKYDVPIWGTLAVALLESAVGQSELARSANNHFGIKASSPWNGPIYCKDLGREKQTGEVICQYYRSYRSTLEGYLDFGAFLHEDPRYEPLFQYAPEDYTEWTKIMQITGYSEDPDYGDKLLDRIKDHKLYKLSKQRPEPIVRA